MSYLLNFVMIMCVFICLAHPFPPLTGSIS
ncbi:Uncharacterized protein APZ42_019470 [Daphnia magna]|uniref:Uncharacterized protein n=1 Tax=Daphnia magna TaxID=35525 RepID=A0A164Y6K5_9CRUS|nr:Uncharacterized protein APZ42_019470 [Daphnia magna]